MNTTQLVLDILQILIPLAAVVIVVYITRNRKQTPDPEAQEEPKDENLQPEVVNILLPMQLQATERLVLYLERISPEQLFFREPASEEDARSYAFHLIRLIQAEFDHNAAQQIYLHDNVWQAVVTAKQWIMELINQAAENLAGQGDGRMLQQLVLDTTSKADELPTQQAIAIVKSYIQEKYIQ